MQFRARWSGWLAAAALVMGAVACGGGRSQIDFGAPPAGGGIGGDNVLPSGGFAGEGVVGVGGSGIAGAAGIGGSGGTGIGGSAGTGIGGSGGTGIGGSGGTGIGGSGGSGIGGSGVGGIGGSGGTGIGGSGGTGIGGTGGSGGSGGGGVLACIGCVAQTCPDVQQCLFNATCRNGAACVVTQCLTGGLSLQCALNCFNGDVTAARQALQGVQCVLTQCGSTCLSAIPGVGGSSGGTGGASASGGTGGA